MESARVAADLAQALASRRSNPRPPDPGVLRTASRLREGLRCAVRVPQSMSAFAYCRLDIPRTRFRHYVLFCEPHVLRLSGSPRRDHGGVRAMPATARTFVVSSAKGNRVEPVAGKLFARTRWTARG
jgi:hypothetical protein